MLSAISLTQMDLNDMFPIDAIILIWILCALHAPWWLWALLALGAVMTVLSSSGERDD